MSKELFLTKIIGTILMTIEKKFQLAAGNTNQIERPQREEESVVIPKIQKPPTFRKVKSGLLGKN
eukprot:UN01117